MTSERQRQANRKNARYSTGPRTPAGKARVGHNAYKHGLSVPASAQGLFETEVSSLAFQLIKDLDLSPALHLEAHAAADAQIDLLRVRSIRAALLVALERGRLSEAADSSPARRRNDNVADPKLLLQALERLDRYERRALTRRKLALRRLWPGMP